METWSFNGCIKDVVARFDGKESHNFDFGSTSEFKTHKVTVAGCPLED